MVFSQTCYEMNAMDDPRPLTFLCITTYEKGQEFMRECKRHGCRVVLLTAEKLRDADWPRESLDDTFYLPAIFATSWPCACGRLTAMSACPTSFPS